MRQHSNEVRWKGEGDKSGMKTAGKVCILMYNKRQKPAISVPNNHTYYVFWRCMSMYLKMFGVRSGVCVGLFAQGVSLCRWSYHSN